MHNFSLICKKTQVVLTFKKNATRCRTAFNAGGSDPAVSDCKLDTKRITFNKANPNDLKQLIKQSKTEKKVI